MKPDDVLQAVLGTQVTGQNGSTVGRLVDVLVDKAGSPQAAVLDVGGFMGVGSRRVAVPWRDLHFDPANKDATIAVSLSADQIKAAPEYKGPPRPAQPAPPAPAAAPQTPPAAPAAAPPPAPPGPAGPVADPDGPAPAAVLPAPEPKPSTPAR
ncbi:MAG: PRC-barrel domain-containing protein [Acetobacteraceae bacterium]|nr:PRC-barrel domain-containing protein [Acetobacteraceae bacterium]